MIKIILILLLSIFPGLSFSSAVNMELGDSEDKLYEIEGIATHVTELTVKNKVFVTYFYQATNTFYVVDKTRKTICKISLGEISLSEIEGVCL